MEQTIALIQRSQDGDEKARAQLVEENTGLIWCVVRRFMGRGVETDDLFQIGSIGLLKAIDKFDLTFDVKFSTYAVPMISGEIKRFLRDDGMIKVSRSLKELAYKIHMAQVYFQENFMREPTLEEVAGYLQVDTEDVVLALDAANEVESLYKPVYQKDGNEVILLEKLEDGESQEEKLLNRILLQELLDGLEKEARELLYLRYFSDKTQSEIGRRLGMSQVQVSRMEKKILKHLRGVYFAEKQPY